MQRQLMIDLTTRFQFDLQDEIRAHGVVVRGALVIAYQGTLNLELSKAMYELHKSGAEFKSRSWGASQQSALVKLDCIEPDVYFSYEAHNPLIQLADIVSSSVAWTLKNKELQFLKPRKVRSIYTIFRTRPIHFSGDQPRFL